MVLRYWSDLHLGHQNVYKFTASADPSKLMRDFTSMEECEQLMVDNYNRVVEADDIVYFLGDVWFDKKHAKLLTKMKKGSKRLVLGNHDNKGDVTQYREYFDKVHGALYFNKVKAIGTHIPVHHKFLGERYDGTVRFTHNVHGHTHDSFIKLENGQRDPRYLNCSVEAVNYTPATWEELLQYAV